MCKIQSLCSLQVEEGESSALYVILVSTLEVNHTLQQIVL